MSIFPPEQGAPPHHDVDEKVKETEEYACWRCGETRTFSEGAKFTPCQRCKGKKWVAPDKTQSNQQK